ncbi:MAG: PTS glucose transporter subunit IIA [Tissierellia bacterium]|nr:PTS glucose transporter subunit IIA [Tissierellia bacterium]
MFDKSMNFRNFAAGKVLRLEDVKDSAFSNGIMGDGYAIEPVDGRIYAPFDGLVKSIYPENHAYILKADNGLEILLHLGINTVDLSGYGFERRVNVGDVIKQGDLICTMDIEKIKEKGKETTCIMVVNGNRKVKLLKEGVLPAFEGQIIEII